MATQVRRCFRLGLGKKEKKKRTELFTLFLLNSNSRAVYVPQHFEIVSLFQVNHDSVSFLELVTFCKGISVILKNS